MDREQLRQETEVIIDQYGWALASITFEKINDLIVEAAKELAIAEGVTNSGIIHGAMRKAYAHALHLAQLEELLERSSCDVLDAAQAARV